MDYGDYVETGTMPSAISPDESEEEKRQRIIREADGSRGWTALDVGATNAPKMPPYRPEDAPAAPELKRNFMPPISPAAAPARPENPLGTRMPPVPVLRAGARSDAFRGGVGNSSGAGSPEFLDSAVSAARGASTRPAIAGTNRGNALPERDTSDPASREFFDSAVDAARRPAAVSAPTVDIAHPLGANVSAATPAAGASSGNRMPPIFYEGAGEHPRQPEAVANANVMPAVQVGPATKRFQDINAQGPPELHGWKKVLDTIGQILPFGRAIETAIPGSPQNYDARFNAAAMRAAKEQTIGKEQQAGETAAAQAQFNTPERRRAYMQKNPDLFDDVSDFQKHDWVLSGKFPQKEPPPPKPERPENLDREAYDDYVSKGLSPAEARRRVLQDAQDVKPDRATHTSPFEAFAYGSPEEKKSAKDFLSFEKRMGAQYQRPTEAEFRYSLFQRDPEGYKAVFGDKAATGDRAHATDMLKFFQRQRDSIQKDFMLGDDEKAQKLQEIDEVERPFKEAAGVGGTEGNGDRVNVIHPDGTRGTIPRSQLPAAKRKGYRVVQ